MDFNPYQSVCAVSLKLYDGHEELEGTSSGILIDARQCLVLTHASLLYPVVDKIIPEKLQKLKKTGFVDNTCLKGQIKIDVILGNDTVSKSGEKMNTEKPIQISLLNSVIQEGAEFTRYKGTFKSVFECRILRDTLEKLTPKESWQFVEDPVTNINDTKSLTKTSNNEELYAFLLPCFILIKLTNISDFEKTKLDDNFSIRSSNMNKQGHLVEICATPFGVLSPEVFFNSLSCGIISNVAGPRGVLIMTDARCVPGCEGGALFVCEKQKRVLAGIMIASLCWKNNEWVGLSMACSISELIESLHRLALSSPRESFHMTAVGGSSLSGKLIERMIRNVTYITVGHSWGTGIYISPGIVLTCSHVLRGHHRNKVLTDRQTNNKEEGCEIVFQTPNDKQFDIALVKIPQHFNRNIPYSLCAEFSQVQEGDVVYVVGHAIFKPDLDLSPMVTRGIVSKIIRFNNIPVMVQTTCAVHAGVSGGGVFNVQGHLVAIVVCNSRDTETGACYPHINMCIPVKTMEPVIMKYLASQGVLKSLHINNKQIENMWSIGVKDDVSLQSTHCCKL